MPSRDPEYNRMYYAAHAEQIKARRRQYHAEHREEENRKHTEYRTVNRDTLLDKQRKFYWDHHDDVRKYQREYNKGLRRATLEAYGGVCTCCGEAQEAFLEIHHENGGGGEHRASLSTSMDLWLKKEGYPTGFTLLCANCHTAITQRGYCPHQAAP
jgi:hypothetical protein